MNFYLTRDMSKVKKYMERLLTTQNINERASLLVHIYRTLENYKYGEELGEEEENEINEIEKCVQNFRF